MTSPLGGGPRPVTSAPATTPPPNVVPGSVVSGTTPPTPTPQAPSTPKDGVAVQSIRSDGMTEDASGKMQEAKLKNEIGNVLNDSESDDIGQLKDAMHKMAEEFGPEVGEKMFNKLFMDPKSSAEYDKALTDAAKKYKELKKSNPSAAEDFKKEMACKMCEKINKTKNGEDDPGC
ncbi:MAG: hypothetical protein AB7I41_13600 [Candidatus Sericytochromatia bacterium]